MYFFLICDDDFDEKKYCYFDGALYNSINEKVSKFIFSDSSFESELKEPFTLILNESVSKFKKRELTDAIFTFAVGPGSLFVVSPKAADFLINIDGVNIKLFNLNIKGTDFELSDYKIVQILKKIDCVDFDKSDLDFDKKYDLIEGADSIVLDAKKIDDNCPLFLLSKRPDEIRIVHKDLKEKIEKSGLTGFKFHSMDEAYEVIV